MDLKQFGLLLIKKRRDMDLSLRDAAEKIGISHSYLSSLEKAKDPRSGGEIKPTIETIKLLCDFYKLDLSKMFLLAGYEILVNKENKPIPPEFTKRDEKDIAKTLEKLMNDLDHDEGLMFYNEPMTDEDRELLKQALELGVRIAKQKNKETYTPKKYKKK